MKLVPPQDCPESLPGGKKNAGSAYFLFTSPRPAQKSGPAATPPCSQGRLRKRRSLKCAVQTEMVFVWAVGNSGRRAAYVRGMPSLRVPGAEAGQVVQCQASK